MTLIVCAMFGFLCTFAYVFLFESLLSEGSLLVFIILTSPVMANSVKSFMHRLLSEVLCTLHYFQIPQM